MNRLFKNVMNILAGLMLISFCFALTAQAQNREEYLISARAGGINFVSGKVTLHLKGADEGQSLTVKDDVKSGDIVRTGTDGRIEMLLNPGSFVRLAGDAEMELVDSSLENLRLKLSKGSALIEASGADDDRAPLLEIVTPQTKVAIIRNGVYRVNILPGGATEVITHQGRARIGDDPKMVVKGGKRATVTQGHVELAKFDKKEKDEFDLWGKERAKTLAKVNSKLKRDTLMASFAGNRSRLGYSPLGLWVFNRRFGCYTYLPFDEWSSPYGHFYSNSFWGWGLDPFSFYGRPYYYPRRRVIRYPSGDSPSRGGTSNPNPVGNSPQPSRPAAPPSRPIERPVNRGIQRGSRGRGIREID